MKSNERQKKHARSHRNPKPLWLCCLILGLLLGLLVCVALRSGSLHVGTGQLLRGIFGAHDTLVATVLDLRAPRICAALLGGAAVAVAGTLTQAVLKNPLADPTILGISGGAHTAAQLAGLLVPALWSLQPLFAVLGGLAAFLILVLCAGRAPLSPIRIVLTGVAVTAFFSGVAACLGGVLSGGIQVDVSGGGNLLLKTWGDIHIFSIATGLGLGAALLSAGRCNLLQLEDQNITALGRSTTQLRLTTALIAVMLASVAAAYIGTTAFLGLVAPHAARRFVGTNHRKLLLFSALLGAFVLLLADTVGRVITKGTVSAEWILSLVGAPCFICLLRAHDRTRKEGHT